MKNKHKKKATTLEKVVGIFLGIGFIALAAYASYKKDQQKALAAKEPESIDELLAALDEAIKNEDYEAAAVIRDKINALKKQTT